jgi:hypothetical protein
MSQERARPRQGAGQFHALVLFALALHIGRGDRVDPHRLSAIGRHAARQAKRGTGKVQTSKTQTSKSETGKAQPKGTPKNVETRLPTGTISEDPRVKPPAKIPAR